MSSDGNRNGSKHNGNGHGDQPLFTDNKRIRVLVADDHSLVREGVRLILEREGFEVVADAVDGRQAVRLAEEHVPDIAVLDVSMPRLNGLDAGRQILQLFAGRVAIVLLTVHEEQEHVVAAIHAGVRGYIVKTQGITDLSRAMREVAAGGFYFSPSVCGVLVGAYLTGVRTPSDPLSAREREVLQLVAEGKTTKEVASTLGLSTKTAEWYRARLMGKLGIHDTAGLVRYALRRGLIELS
jgi:DNA-binding NarL/FixJ family response regulator